MAGNRIRELRRARGFSLKSLAHVLSDLGPTSVHFTTVGKMERGEIGISLEWLRRIAAVLDVSVLELISDDAGQGPGKVAVVTLPKGASGPDEAVVTGYVRPFPYSERSFLVSGLLEEYNPAIEAEARHDSLLIDPEDRELVDGRLYLVMGDDGEQRVRRYRERPPRFEGADRNDEAKHLVFGRDTVRVLGGAAMIDPKWQFVREGDQRLAESGITPDTPLRFKR